MDVTPLFHCVVVRRDLPAETVIAQVAHAAGESFFKLSFPGSSEKERSVFNGEAPGSSPGPGATFDPHKTIVEIRGARNEGKLLRLERQLTDLGIAHVAIREPDAPWNGQMMAIGLVPGPKDQLWDAVNEFQRFKVEHNSKERITVNAFMSVSDVARAAHEVNRGYCASLGDESQAPWESAPQWQKDSAIKGVVFHLTHPEATPANSHESWLAEKREAGWKFGPVKDPEKKEHPCFLPYHELPVDQRAKDYLFRATVKALEPHLSPEATKT